MAVGIQGIHDSQNLRAGLHWGKGTHIRRGGRCLLLNEVVADLDAPVLVLFSSRWS